MFGKKNDQIKTKAVAGGGLVTAAMVTAAVFLGLANPEGAKYTAEFEAVVLQNYIDSVGVETWCVGETQMGRLEEGYTHEYCMALFKARYSGYSARLYDCYNEKAKRYVTPKMHTAFVDVYYNTGARCKTGMIRNLKNGNPVAACDYTLQYKRAGGVDCSKTKGLSVSEGGCYGVWDRRITLHPICKADAEQIPPDGLGEEDANSVN